MGDISSFELPTVADEDIVRACALLGLGEQAFCGPTRCDPRNAVLKCMDPMDVAACPGSGKTTLLVAKLAILAEKWSYRTRGICVLSHANAARRQIEERLGNTTAGRRLLAYPHYIGTIHGFVDAYLAVPWLRSCGYPIKAVNTEICQEWRWRKLSPKWQHALEKRHCGRGSLSIATASFDVQIKGIGAGTDTCGACQEVCRQSAEAGYFCYDEMFVWAEDLMKRVPSVVATIRDRFPLLFIDEAQDNSEEQSHILHRIFLRGGGAVARQRLGDGNQAIFDSVGAGEAKTDRFPDDTVKKDLPNTHRFGQKIADLADPLGLAPYGLVGQGPGEPLQSGQAGAHTIFLFGHGEAGKVLPAYGDLLLATFSEQELRRGVFAAIGQVHRPPESTDKYPHSVGDYWPSYDPQLTSADPRPRCFVQYVSAGRGRARTSGEAHHCVEKIAEGILRLASTVEAAQLVPRRAHNHRYVRTLLKDHPTERDLYDQLLATTAVTQSDLSKEEWTEHWRDAVKRIVTVLVGCKPSGDQADAFLAWPQGAQGSQTPTVTGKGRDNLYRYPKNGQRVGIRVGSIHSAKGETHAATLVLETFYYDYNLEKAIPWLEGSKSGGTGQTRMDERLKLHYVAMTRPTHLLCLAMRRDSFCQDDDLDQEAVERLEKRGWRVQCI